MKRLALLLTLAAWLPAEASIYTVRPDGSGDFPTIQAAIETAQDGDTVLLTSGIFQGDGNRDLDLAGKAISVEAQSADPESCVIDCQGSAESPHRGFWFHGGESIASRVAGLTITHGFASGSWPTGAGGAVLCYQSEPTIERCRFIDNQAGWGGAVAVGSATVRLAQCSFLGNVAAYRGGAADGFTHGNLLLDHCTLAVNAAPCGAGVGANVDSAIRLANDILAFGTDGGSVCCTHNSTATASCCDVFGNAEGDYVDGLSGQLGVDGNLSLEPFFCNLSLHDVRLQAQSPCAGEHQPVCGQIGAWPVGCETHEPTILVVRPDGTGDYPTIQAAVDAAQNGDVVLLTDGTFRGDGNRDVDFAGKAITVTSQSGDPAACVIDCEGSAESPQRGFTFHSVEASSSRLTDITITHGYAAGSWPTGAGGAVLCYQSEPTIERCRFIDNHADWGGAIAAGSATVRPNQCTFLGNRATYRGGAADGYTHGNLFLDHCTLALNAAPCGSAIGANGYCVIRLTNDILAFGTNGAAVCGTNHTTLTATCCNVFGNTGGNYVDGLAGLLGRDGNISVEPFFCDLPSYAVHLQPQSPCAAGHQPECGQIGAWPIGCQDHTPGTLVVRPDGTGDQPTIQAAIDAALPGDTIELADGIFTGAGNRDVSFHGRSVTVRSQSGDARTCVIDCQGAATEPHRGFLFVAEEGAASVLADVTISSGCVAGAWPAGGGGAILCQSAAPAITGCVFTGNHAAWGGAIAAEGGALRPVACTFAANVATHRGGAIDARAEAIPELDRCTLVRNAAPAGSAVGWDQSHPLALRRTIIAYHSPGEPVSCSSNASVEMSCCDLYGNMPGDYLYCLASHLESDGNISADPRFCDLEALDLQLEEGSVCAGEQQPECGQIGAWPVGCAAHAPTVYRVEADGSGDWPTIQAAIDAAHGGDTVELGDGTYRGPGNRDLDFGLKALTLQSHSGQADACVIDCEGSAETPHRAIALDPTTISGSVIRNVAMAHGYADRGGALCTAGQALHVEGCVFTENRARRGGAVNATGGAPVLEACRFAENAADSAGGALAIVTTARARVMDCTFEANTAALLGGGLYVSQALLEELSGCVLTGNAAADGGGALLFHSGYSSVTGCTFDTNAAAGSGGGLFCQGGAPAVDTCLFAANQALRGAGIYSWDADPTLSHCTLAENLAAEGAGLWVRGHEVTVANSIIAFSPGGDAVRCGDVYRITLACCDLFGNAGGDWVGCIEDQAGQYDNLCADPLFCGEGSETGPYALQLESPCAPQNNPACGLIGAGPIGCGAASAPGVPERPTTWALALAPNQPNPFAAETLIGYTVPGRDGKRDVVLAIYDAAGRRIRTLIDAPQAVGPRRVVWRGSDASGAPVASGIYFCRIRVGGETLTRRLTLLR